MQRTFLMAKKFLEGEFEHLTVTGENYPVPPVIQLLLSLVQVLQLFSMAAALFGDTIWTWVGVRRPPSLYYTAKDYSVAYFVILFLVVPKFFTRWTVTGAFEVVLDGVTMVYSKLETGKMPSAEDLTQPLVAAGLEKIVAKTS
jgi:selT/selW/selH-like putative selenoprotein